jgi:hypothetical protein
LIPVVRGFIPDGLRSRPFFGVASLPIGDKSPRYRCSIQAFSAFVQAKKNPPKRVFPKTIIDSLSAAILAMVDHP